MLECPFLCTNADKTIDNLITYGSFAEHASKFNARQYTDGPGRLIMANRLSLWVLAQLIILGIVTSSVAQAQTAPQLKNAVSRKLQGGKAFDIALPLNGGSGIECRSGDSLAVVLTFDQPISSANVALNSGNATISGMPVVSGNTITVNLVNVANAQDLK